MTSEGWATSHGLLCRMRFPIPIAASLLFGHSVLGAGSIQPQKDLQEPLVVRIGAKTLNVVPETLFGEFLERPSWDGERGPEAFFSAGAPGFLPTHIVSALVDRKSPLLRFPGGTDVDYTDWHALVDGAADESTRANPRPVSVGHRGATVTNRFGWHEYFALREKIGAKTLVTLNFRDSLVGDRSPREAALYHAGLLVYLATPVGASLPSGMADWPSLRAKNGHPAPFPVDYVQIGNEWFAGGYTKDVPVALDSSDSEALAGHYIAHLHAYLDVIREVLPNVPIIIDGVMSSEVNRRVLEDPRVRQEVRLIALHSYAPWEVSALRNRADRKLAATEVTDADWWYALQAMPGVWQQGVPLGLFGEGTPAPWQGLPYRIACTEWNWVGWWGGLDEEHPAFELNAAGALGAASFLHALLRSGDRVELAIQSMLLGERWVLASLLQPEGQPLELSPQGEVLKHFRQHHGKSRVEVSIDSSPTPHRLSVGLQSAAVGDEPSLPLYEVTATQNPDRIFVHLINRHHEQHLPVHIMDTAKTTEAQAHLVGLQAPWERGRAGRTMRSLDSKVERNSAGALTAILPPRSVAVVLINRPAP
jgi:alpha-L-arabinofuranosidase